MNTKIRAGKNVWVQWGGRDETTIVAHTISGTRPEASNRREWYPHYPASRVTGDTYRPYDRDGSEWVEAANEAMASDAQANFQRRNSF